MLPKQPVKMGMMKIKPIKKDDKVKGVQIQQAEIGIQPVGAIKELPEMAKAMPKPMKRFGKVLKVLKGK